MGMILFLSILGLGTSAALFLNKHLKNQNLDKLICPTDSGCEVVKQSKYRKTFGIENEVLGIFYYAFLIYLDLSGQLTVSSSTANLAGIVTTLGTIFAVRLIRIQIFLLKGLCMWCLIGSATIIPIFIIFLFK